MKNDSQLMTPHTRRSFLKVCALAAAVAVFDRAAENPTTRYVDDCVAIARAAGIVAFVALGGGSSLDRAKIAS